jgi:hypothetical protein
LYFTPGRCGKKNEGFFTAFRSAGNWCARNLRVSFDQNVDEDFLAHAEFPTVARGQGNHVGYVVKPLALKLDRTLFDETLSLAA